MDFQFLPASHIFFVEFRAANFGKDENPSIWLACRSASPRPLRSNYFPYEDVIFTFACVFQ